MKTFFAFLKFLALATWVLVASIIITLISVTSPNWTPVNFLITQNPLIGRARKSIGSNIGYKWFNKNVFRSKALQFTEGESASREVQKLFFKECQAWAKTLLNSVRVGFKQMATDMPAYSWYIGWLLREAGDSYPGPATLDKTKIVVSKGTLQQPSDLTGLAVADLKGRLTWTNDSGSGNALATDSLMVIWYNRTTSVAGSELTGTVKRPAGTFTSAAALGNEGDTVYIWGYFVSADGQIVSDSGLASTITLITS